jgi:hypothetical protein
VKQNSHYVHDLTLRGQSADIRDTCSQFVILGMTTTDINPGLFHGAIMRDLEAKKPRIAKDGIVGPRILLSLEGGLIFRLRQFETEVVRDHVYEQT